MSTYRLVYDAAAAGYTDWWFPAAGLGMLVIVCALIVRARRSTGAGRAPWKLLVGVPFLMLWAVVAFASTYASYANLRDRIASGRFTVVEGTVSDFHPSDSGDHQEESWSVESGGQTFHYHYVRSHLSPGFRQTAVHGGPIREGLHVRIRDVDGYIARLEVAP